MATPSKAEASRSKVAGKPKSQQTSVKANPARVQTRPWRLKGELRSTLAATTEGDVVIELNTLDPLATERVTEAVKQFRGYLQLNVTSGKTFHFSLADVTVARGDMEVQRLVDASAPNADKADAIQARMRAKAVALVMGGTSWLTASELFSELEKKPSNVHTTLARWLEQGRIFALEKNGVRIFPRYAFDAMVEPVPLLKEVLKVLAGRSPFQIASWFESPSNYLNGKRPREVLELDGLAVVMAAKRLVEGAVHG
jgi:hypothetical protein